MGDREYRVNANGFAVHVAVFGNNFAKTERVVVEV